MAAALPVPSTTEIEAKHRHALTSFEARAKAISARPINILTANLAQELDTEAKRWLAAFDAEINPIIKKAYDAHRGLTAFREKMSRGADYARTVCRRIQGTYDMQQRLEQERKRTEAERTAREAADALKKQQVDALLAEAANAPAEQADAILAEAVAAEAEPAIPVITASVEAAPKVEGSSTRYAPVLEVKDAVAYLRALADLAEHAEVPGDCIKEVIAEFRMTGLQAQWKRGLRLNGVKHVCDEPITSNRSR